jgi:hypothetical protein
MLLLTLKKSHAQKDFDYSLRLEKMITINTVTKDTAVRVINIVAVKRGASLMLFDPAAPHDKMTLLYDGWDGAHQWLAYAAGSKVVYILPQIPMIQIIDPLKGITTIYQ